MYKLYGSPGAASFAVHWLLLELGEPFEVQFLDFAQNEQKSPQYLRLNPNGHVPVLVKGELVMYEAAAIAIWLSEQHPALGLAIPASAPERALGLQWMFHLANGLQPVFRQWFYPTDYIEPPENERLMSNAKARIEACFERINAHLSQQPYFAGAQPCVVDFHGLMLMRWSRNMPKPATEWPAIAAFVKRMKARPSFKTLNAREGLTEWL
jgi:glutathione S-transferase